MGGAVLLMKSIFLPALLDSAEAWQLGIQDPATPVMESMISFHNVLILIMLIIAIFICWMLFIIIKSFNSAFGNDIKDFTHSSILEILWTIFPAIILLILSIPSFTLLYSLDELIDPSITIKIIGHQWYWSYEYSDYSLSTENVEDLSLDFDSYMINSEDLTYGSLRLLEVDNRVIMPINTHIRLLITAADVLHSWAVPSFGLKIDACPGRLSQASLFIKRPGVYYGQCSEICGVNHGFMPITVRAVSEDKFFIWINTKVENLILEN